MTRYLGPALALIVLAAPVAAQRALPSPPPDRRLTVADVVSVTGIQDVRAVARGAMPGAGGAVNFATSSGLLVMANFGGASLYERAKAQKTIKVMDKDMPMVLFHAAVPGLGDEAFDSPPGPVQYALYVRKGQQALSLATFFNRGGKTPKLTMDQLKALAKIVLPRM